jgi:hypothetical protein
MVKNHEQISFFHAEEIDLPETLTGQDVPYFAALISLLSAICDRNVIMQAKCKGLVPAEKAVACMGSKRYPNILRSAFVDFFTNCYARSFNIALTQLYLPSVCEAFLEIAGVNDSFLFEPEIAEPMLQLLNVMFGIASGVNPDKFGPSLKLTIEVCFTIPVFIMYHFAVLIFAQPFRHFSVPTQLLTKFGNIVARSKMNKRRSSNGESNIVKASNDERSDSFKAKNPNALSFRQQVVIQSQSDAISSTTSNDTIMPPEIFPSVSKHVAMVVLQVLDHLGEHKVTLSSLPPFLPPPLPLHSLSFFPYF